MTVTDEHEASAQTTLTIVVTGTNDAPVAEAKVDSVVEDSTITGTLTASDVDLGNGESLVFSTESTVAGLTLNANGSYSFDASSYDSLEKGEKLTLTIPVTVTDEHEASAQTTLTIVVTGTNDAPVAEAKVDSVVEDSTITGTLTASDVDLGNGESLVFSTESTVAGLTLNANGSYSFDASSYDSLEKGEKLTLTIPVTVTDEHEASAQTTLTIVVTGTNDAPVAEAKVDSVVEDSTITGTLTASDVDLGNGESLVFSTESTVAGLTLNANGSYSFDASSYDSLEKGEKLTLTIPVTVTDEHEASAQTTLTIVVTGTNDAPVAEAKVDSVVEDSTITGTLTASDVDLGNGESLVFSTESTVAGLTLNANGSYSFDASSYDSLEKGEKLTLTIPVTVTDEHEASAQTTLTIVVTGTNDAPIAVADSETVNEGSTIVVTKSVLTNDTDAESDSLSVVGLANGSKGEGSVTANADGSFTIVTALGGTVVMQANGTYTYTANVLNHSSSDTIQDSFTYLAGDGTDSSAWTTVTIDVIDTGITAKDDFAEIAKDSNSVSGNVITNDLQDDTDLAVTVTSVAYGGETYLMPVSGVLTINAATGILEIDSEGRYTFTAVESLPATVVTDVTTNTNISVYASTNESIIRSGAVENNGSSGLGVSSFHDKGNQIDGNESLVIKLDNAASVVSATLNSNGNGNDDEVEIAVYDTSGMNISEQASISIVNHVVTVTSTNGDIGYVVFGLSSAANSNDKYYVDEKISVTYSNTNTPSSEVFTYNVKDSDGDTSSATLTINGIDTVNEAPEITFSSGADNLVVSEEGLVELNANPDSEGIPDTTNDAIAQGTFSVSDVDTDSDDLSVSLTAPDVALYSNNVAIEWSTENGNLVGKAGNETILVISLSQDSSNLSSYSYTVTLLGSLDHADKTAEDTLSFDVGVEVSDGTNTVKDSITVTVEDDSPEVPINIVVDAVEHNETTTISLGDFNFTQRPNDSGCHNNNAYTFIDTNSGNSVFVYAVGLLGTHHEELTFSNNSGMGVKSSSFFGPVNDRTDGEIDYQYGNSEKIVMELGDKVAYGMQVSLAEFYSNEGEKGKIIFLLDGKVVQEEDLIATHSNGNYSASFNVASGFDEVRFEAVTNGNGWCSDNSDYSIKSVSFESVIVDPVIATDEGTITADFGADGAGVITLTGVADTNIKTADGLPVTLGSTDVVDGVKTQVWVDIHGDKVFEIELNSSTGEWSYRQFAELAKGDSVEITYDVVDADGDIVSSTSPNTGTDNDFTSGLKGEFYNVGYQLGTIAQAVYVTEHQNANATFTSSEISYIGQDWDDLGDYDWRNESTNLESWLGDDAQSVEFKNKTDSNDAVVRLIGGVALDAGTYSIKVNADDGYRIIIDGRTVASFDSNTSVRSEEFTFSVDENGIHQIEVIYWDQGGAYVLEVSLNDGSGYELLGSEAYPTYSSHNVEVTDYVNLVGTSNNNHLVGTAANDHIQGLGAQDHLSGGDGDDWLEGGEGDDHLIGGSGKDILDGGSGQDSLSGGSGDDKLYGQQGDDLLSGESGRDYLDGGQGQDYLYGGLGKDILVGGDGDDKLFGDEGADVLIGGSGHDQLTGGSGSDVFVIEGSNSSDTIMDFNVQEDIVDISELLNIDSSSDHDAIQAYLDSESSSLSITANGDGSATISVADHSAGSFGADSHIVSGDIVSVLFNNQEYTLKVD
ncbi:VCBS domain-containing protein [Vibrio plantisponsor]|uniref:VCBS domain-containing protein n=1 Tax=Vibrio plantisponsor TaxID=664643 RepID=A0ABU4IE14_9VIBR|nr:VCBS domain-containing protein [Vibrio plantisponsor]MDW6016807.1 VCBS domain-containing protein [Vibrio plantisponsor]